MIRKVSIDAATVAEPISSSSSSNKNNHNNSEKLKLKLNTKTKKKKRSPVFPQRLYEMLEDAEEEGYAHLIHWSPDGTSFHLSYDTQNKNNSTNKAFVEVLTRRFNQTQFKSFLRQLQLYGFERQFKGSRKGECKHPLFQRHHKELLVGKSIEEYQDATTHNALLASRMMMCTNQPQQPQQQSVLVSSAQEVDTHSIPPPPPLHRYVSTDEPTTTTICTSTSKCNYRATSIIPTTLINLVLPDDDDNADADDDNDDDATTASNGSDDNNSLGSNTVFNRTFYRPSICSNTCDNYEYFFDCDDDVDVDMQDENRISVDDSNYDFSQWIGSSIYRI